MADALTQTIKAAKRVILSLGSGDGSQQAAIVKSGHRNIVSTFFDTEVNVCSKYGTATGHIAFLRRSHSTVLFEVDATKLHEHPDLRGKEFDIILFTFPHTGMPNFSPRHSGPSHNSIESNKRLIKYFIKSAQHLVTKDGEIVITLKTSAPYDKWSFPDFADYEVELKSQHLFDAHLFPDYTHRSTKIHSKGTVVQNGAAKTYVFGRKRRQPGDNMEDKDGDSPAPRDTFHPRHSFKLSLQFTEVTDGNVETFAVEVLSSSQQDNLDALDIRRRLPEAIRPDTRQLNRVLYHMESSGRVTKGPPNGSSNKKPTWKLATVPANVD
jgi:25S rRNA (uracil2634-N3)-methyltransferase